VRKIRRGDEIVVIAGKNKGQRGKVRVNLIKEDRVIVEGVNIVIKHIKPVGRDKLVELRSRHLFTCRR